MNNRIDQRFANLRGQGRKALVPFITAGDPQPQWTVEIMHSLVSAGADVIELGVPFSDPMADGPVIQLSSERAIEKGVTLTDILSMVMTFRQQDQDTPVILMGYLNPIERYGYEHLANDAADAGVDGFLLVDCPPEEARLLKAAFEQQHLHLVYLIAPTTTDERIQYITANAGGFVYYVSLKGVTGSAALQSTELAQPLRTIRRFTDLPVGVGFGIKDAESAVAVADVADAIVIGSALVARLAECADQQTVCQQAEEFLAEIRAAVDNSNLESLQAAAK